MGTSFKKLVDKSLRHTECLTRMRHRGVRVDEGALRALSPWIEDEKTRTMSRIRDFAVVQAMEDTYGPFNPRSAPQKRRLIYEYLGLPIIHRSAKTQEPNTDKLALADVAEEVELVRLVLYMNSLLTAETNFVKNIRDNVVDGRVHPHWKNGGARTYRISCAQPNKQNFPSPGTELATRIRNAFIPEPGHVLVEMDYSQMELRIMASLSEEEHMIDSFIQGEDIHLMAASRLYDIAPEDVTEFQRKRGKTLNFAVGYGSTEYGLEKNFGIPLEEGKELLRLYWLKHPKVAAFMETQTRIAREQGYVESPFGRRRHLPRISSGTRKERNHARNQAGNFPIQSPAAEITLDAMMDVEAYGLFPQAQVHDSIRFSFPESIWEELSGAAEHGMVNQGQHFMEVPLTVDIKVGTKWGEMEDAS